MKKFRRAAVAVFAAMTLALGHDGANASETLSYSYDALGRLVKVAHSGTINSNTSGCYSYDRADNRKSVAVSTSSDCSPASAVSFSINDATAREGGSLVFTVTRTGTPSGTATVDYATADESATALSDYTSQSGTLTFLSTDPSTKTVTILTTDDAIRESDETMQVGLSNATGSATIGDGQGVGTIQDNETDCANVSFTIASNGPVTEGANSVFTVTKSGASSYSCSVSYATASGTSGNAVSGTDFTATSGALTFTSAQTSKTVSVPTINDSTAEFPETFTMSLSNPDKSGSLGTPSTATATINDNDACAAISFTIASNGAVTEGGVSSFTITKHGSSTWTCGVNFATANATAVAPGDYTAASNTLFFTSAQTSQIVTVNTVDDASVESAETFNMNLSSPTSGGTLGTPSSAAATINDNDSGGVCSGVGFSVNDPAAVLEGSPLTFTVTKAGSTSSSCSVSYATANGTAVAPTEYTAKSGTLAFSSSQTSQTVTVTTIDNHRPKGNHTLFLNLTTATNGGSITDSQGVGTLMPDSDTCLTCLQTADPGSTDSSTTDPPPTGD